MAWQTARSNTIYIVVNKEKYYYMNDFLVFSLTGRVKTTTIEMLHHFKLDNNIDWYVVYYG